MGFFSSLWSGIKDVVHSIGTGIKSAVSSVGKFVNKLGVVGQIGLMFVLPGIGGMMAKGFNAVTAGLLGSDSAILNGLGHVLATAGKFGSTVGNVFKTVSDGVLGFAKTVGGSVVNSVGNLLGNSTPLIGSAPSTITEGFSKWMGGVADQASNILSPTATLAKDVTQKAIDMPYAKSMDDALNFNTDYKLPTLGDSTIDPTHMYNAGVDKSMVTAIQKAEMDGQKTLFDKATTYAMNTVKSLPDKVAGAVTSLPQSISDNFAKASATGMAQSLGLQESPVTNITNITNKVPKFDSASMIDQLYQTNGLNYGATPNNRLQFFAANNPQYSGDYGKTGFNQFTGLRSY